MLAVAVEMPKAQVPISRPLVGSIALACLVAAAAIAVFDSYENMWCAAFIRVGLLTGAFWLALPSRTREAAWANLSPYTVLTALVAIFVVARWRAALPIVIFVVIAGMLLRPRERRGSPRGRKS
jgi:hypothetical protein